MRLCILTPDPGYPEPFAWAFHVEAEALREAGAEVTARPWTMPVPSSAMEKSVTWTPNAIPTSARGVWMNE